MKGTINIVIEKQERRIAFNSKIMVEDASFLDICQLFVHLMDGMEFDKEERKLFAVGLLSGALDKTHISSETTDLSAEGGAEA